MDVTTVMVIKCWVCAAELGIFAKKQIPKRTQFGPFVAPTTAEPRSGAAAGQFVLTVKINVILVLKSVTACTE